MPAPRRSHWSERQRHGASRIRLAYLSADFHSHATAYLVAELFERHDRARFEVVGFSYGPDDASAMRSRLKAGLNRFVDVREAGDRHVAELMRDQGIDIAVDLKGFTANNRAGIFRPSRRAIAGRISRLSATMGALFIDHIIADCQIIPPPRGGLRRKVVRLPTAIRSTIDSSSPSTHRAAPRLACRRVASRSARSTATRSGRRRSMPDACVAPGRGQRAVAAV
jgi:predicted O-linked N-acetylglucosamine transferase (SPINDLY family)